MKERLREPASRPVTIGLLTACALLLGLLIYWIVLLYELPTVREIEASRFEQATIVYTTDGEELTRYHDKNRTWVPLEAISPHVIQALIAAEDRRFYDHWGIDVRRTVGAILRTFGGDRQGGSTITMQLARNAFEDIADDADLTRKIKEWITALRIEAIHGKEEILEMYLNTVPFMYNAFGIEAAANTYFQKAAADLNLKESATLVGMLKGTVYYNPVRNPERSHERRNVVLEQMVAQGALDQGEFERIRDEETELNFRRITREDNLAPYFAEYLRQWLDEWGEENGYNLYTSGLRIHTTIDARLQEAAEQAVREVGENLQAVANVEWSRERPPYFSANARDYQRFQQQVEAFAYYWEAYPEVLDHLIRRTPRYRQLVSEGVAADSALARLRDDAVFTDSVKTVYQRLEIGFVAMDPRDGHVKAWVGGRDFSKDQYDHVALAKRQPGSTFKPFVYAAALESGYGPNDVMRDEVIEYVDPQTRRRWKPTNVGNATGRLITLRDALAYSKNTITAQLVLDIGPSRVVDYAHRMGIQSELDPYLSIGLGTSEVSLLEMAAAYGTIANKGRYQEPLFVTRIEDHSGYVLASFTSEGRSVLSDQTAYTLLDMMRGVVEFGTGVRIRNQFGARGDLAGKTGTTQGGVDGWFMLLHPHMVTGAWVGFNTAAISFRSSYWGQGSHNALHVVGEFVRQADLSGNVSFTEPPGYVPPAPRRDTTLFAVDRWYNESYFDSLRAINDSLLDRRDEVDWDWEPLETEEELDLAEEEPFEEDEDAEDPDADAAGFEDEPDLSELSEADSLTRRERQRSDVSDILRRLREEDDQ